MQTTKPLRAKKRMKTIGAVGRKSIQTRNEWFKQNPGSYTCYLCGIALEKKEVTLDHKLSRSRHPGLRYVLENLAPACWPCNEAKGSYDIHEYLGKVNEGI